MLIVNNISAGTITIRGTPILTTDSYTVPIIDERLWALDATLTFNLQDGNLTIGDGMSTFIGNGAVQHLIDYYVNAPSLRTQIVDSDDSVSDFTWLDYGTSDERVDTIAYISDSYPGVTIIKTFVYVLDIPTSTYKMTSINWSIDES